MPYTDAQIDAKLAALDAKFQNLHNGQNGHIQTLIKRVNCIITEMKKLGNFPCD